MCVVCSCMIVLLVVCPVYIVMCGVGPYILSILWVSLCLTCTSTVCDRVTCCMGDIVLCPFFRCAACIVCTHVVSYTPCAFQ